MLLLNLLHVQVSVTDCVMLECLVCATVYRQLISFVIVARIDICEHLVFVNARVVNLQYQRNDTSFRAVD